MNSCAYYQELISSLVDGELSDEENEALMLHLNSCSRCNAMYAVFHDLSDILSEEPEPLPEGLHENIMAGVRRSEIIKRSRRMRKIGLRTAMTAAACAVLVLFAAAGFNPGKRADSVSIRSEQEASQLLPAPSPAAGTPAVEQAAPASAPVSVQTPAPAQTPAPVYDTESAAAYTPVQPEQSYNDSYDSYQETAPLPAWTPAQPSAPVWTPAQPSVPAQTPAPVYDTDSAAAYTAPLWTPETPAPATPIPATPAPVWTSAPVPAAAPAEPKEGESVTVRIGLTGAVYAHVNTHFDHVGKVAVVKEAEMLVDFIERELAGIPVVFTADLNATPDSDSYAVMTGALQDARLTAADAVSYGTFHACSPETHADYYIDFVMTTPGLEVETYRTVTAGVSGRLVSDHFPIYADVRLPDNGRTIS